MFFIQVKEGNFGIFRDVMDVQKDDYSGPGTADSMNRENCKHH